MKFFLEKQSQKLKLFFGALMLSGVTDVNAQFTETGSTTGTNSPGNITVNGVSVGAGQNGDASGIAYSTAVGFGALGTVNTSNGGYSIAVGWRTLNRNTSGTNNVAIGNESMSGVCVDCPSPGLLVNNTGMYNTAIGQNTLNINTTGNNNVAVGYNSLLKNSTGDGNISIGRDASAGLTSGSNNIGIGSNVFGSFTSGNYNVAIGQGATVTDGQNNQLSIQNFIYGRNLTNTSGTISGNLFIGKAVGAYDGTHYAKLSVAGNTSEPSLQLDRVPTATATGKFLFVDNNGVVSQASLGCTTTGNVPRVTNSNGNLGCSQIYDNGSRIVSIGGFNDCTYCVGAPNNSMSSVGIGVNPNFDFNYTFVPGTMTEFYHTPTATNATYALVVAGTTRALSYFATSDKRLKKDVNEIRNVMTKIKKLQGVAYYWDKEKYPELNLTDQHQLGFLAQDVEKVIPEAVAKGDDGFYAMNYSTLIPVLTEGIKEQQSQIESQDLEIENLKSQITELRNKLNQLTPGDVKLKVNSIEVVPNPITGVSVVSYKLDNTNTASYLIISDLQGKLLKQITLPKNQQQGQVQVSKKDLPNGMYVFAIVSGNTEVQSKKVLVTE